MNTPLPLGVENYLREAGFSGTEIITLKKLLEENFLTVRELAAKTGKGIGTIDVALKKLMRRSIVSKENVNEQPRYKIIDPQAIITWTNKNMMEQREIMERKHQSFAQFMENITVEKNYPEMEHFSGEEGLRKAYDKLLANRQALLTYTDPASMPKHGPLADFREQYSRRRQVHGVFQRIIAPDTAPARHFQSRDPSEYRKTVLVRPEDYPMSFEKIVAGDIVACIDTKTMQASFIHFQTFADAERNGFERLWASYIGRDRASGVLHNDSNIVSRKGLITMNLFQKTAVGYLAVLFAFWLALFITKATAGFYNYLYSFLFGLTPLVSGIVAIVAAKRWGGMKTTIGKAVLCMGLGIFFWGCGAMIWSYYNFILDVPAPYPSLADLGFAPSIFLYGLGVIYLADATGATLGLKNIYAKIFAVIAPLIILSLSYYVLVTIARGGVLLSATENPVKIIFDIAYPLGDFLGLTIAVLISGLSFKYMSGRYTVEILSILAGLAVMFVADFIFSYTTTTGTFYNGNVGDLILTIGTFLLSFGVLGFSKDKDARMIGGDNG